MKFVCDKVHLEPAMATVSRAVNPKSPLPVLGHILLQTRPGGLRLAATDLETGVECMVPAEVSQEGGCTLPARVLQEVIAQLPDGPIQVALLGATVELRCRQAFFRVNALSDEEFPALPQMQPELGIPIPQKVLRNGLRSAAVATATEEETRAVLQGVQMTLSGTQIVFVATDGRRLAKADVTTSDPIPGTQTAIIPARAVAELQRILKDVAEPVHVMMQEGHIFFAVDRTVLSSRLLEGKFPNYNNLLPKGFKIEIGVDRDLFAAAVRRTLVMAQERISPKLVRLLVEGDQMRVQANAPDLGAAEDVVPITRNGPDLE
ncbi:MAG: DNA polymerase III subunit beta, partial [Candidatus Xenobia bacterium]